MKPRTPSDLAADMAWQVVTPREKLPGPGLPIDLPDDDEPVTPFRHWVEDDYGRRERQPYPFATRIVIIAGLSAAAWAFLWIVVRGGLKLAGWL